MTWFVRVKKDDMERLMSLTKEFSLETVDCVTVNKNIS